MKGLILTYLLAYGGAAVALFNPFVGVCIYWIFDIVRPQVMFGWAGPDGSFSEVIAIATIIGWAFKGFGTWHFGRGRLLFILFAANLLWVLVSAAAAPDHAIALGFVQAQLKRSILFIIAVTSVQSVTQLRQLAWVLVGSAGFVAFDLNIRYLGGSNDANAIGYAGMDNNCLAISMLTCLGVAVFLGLYTRPWWEKALAFGSALLIGHTVLLTFSRGGMLGLIVAGVAAVVVAPKRPRYLLAIGAAIVLALVAGGPRSPRALHDISGGRGGAGLFGSEPRRALDGLRDGHEEVPVVRRRSRSLRHRRAGVRLARGQGSPFALASDGC